MRLNVFPGQVDVGGSLERVSSLVRVRINLRSCGGVEVRSVLFGGVTDPPNHPGGIAYI